MPSVAYKILWRAVRERRQATFVADKKYREAYPVILGYSVEGEETLFCYQVGGHTSPGNTLPGWRCFRVENIRDLTSHKEGWLEGASHKKTQTCIQFVDVDANISSTLRRPEPLPFGSSLLRKPRASK
jgi:hypothetical protein